jgi:hypothetical protein
MNQGFFHKAKNSRSAGNFHLHLLAPLELQLARSPYSHQQMPDLITTAETDQTTATDLSLFDNQNSLPKHILFENQTMAVSDSWVIPKGRIIVFFNQMKT